MMPLAVQIKKNFKRLFDQEPLLVRSPGRVNLIGEHTDYNEGFVLPGAIDKEIILAISKRKDFLCHIHAHDLQDSYEGDIQHIRRSNKGWPNYLLGVTDQLIKRGKKITGFNCVFGGDIPIASGLSSSAALEGAIGFALNELFDFNLEKIELVRIGQAAENEFVGVKCGIMDQFINIIARKGKVFRIDCRSLSFTPVPFPSDKIKIILCDTQVRRELASSEYNVRRKQCEQGVRLLRKYDHRLRSLRDVSLNFLDEYHSMLDAVTYKRCAYVIRENFRVLNGCKDLEKGDIDSFGEKMYQSHAGLRDEYQVSCRELDALVDLTGKVPGVLGARMMGAGFGGCTINLVEKKHVTAFIEKIESGYKRRFRKQLKTYTCVISPGVSKI